MATPTEAPKPAPLLVLALLAVAQAGLAIYQWLELVAVRGGATATCAVNETVNCTTVWNSTFASRVHGLTGLPVAGLGLVWALVAAGVALLALGRLKGGRPVEAHHGALKLWGLLGVLSCLTFASASFAMKAVCLTCLGTYALALAFAGVAAFMLPGGLLPKALAPSLKPLVVLLVPVWLVLLYPGLKTPRAQGATALKAPTEAQQYFAALPWASKQAISDARAAWKASEVPAEAKVATQRFVMGDPKAKVHLIDFTDVLCGHCKALVSALSAIERVVPKDALAIEPRYFPLDGECNPAVSRKSGDPVRCLGAKLQLCLEGHPKFAEVRELIFENQEQLDAETLWAIGERAKSRLELQACVASEDTQAKLEQDIKLALAYRLEGTPLVVINGKQTLPVRDFIYGMALTGGDAESPLFGELPAPSPMDAHGHEGHAH